jgi:hypothetical protein
MLLLMMMFVKSVFRENLCEVRARAPLIFIRETAFRRVCIAHCKRIDRYRKYPKPLARRLQKIDCVSVAMNFISTLGITLVGATPIGEKKSARALSILFVVFDARLSTRWCHHIDCR